MHTYYTYIRKYFFFDLILSKRKKHVMDFFPAVSTFSLYGLTKAPMGAAIGAYIEKRTLRRDRGSSLAANCSKSEVTRSRPTSPPSGGS